MTKAAIIAQRRSFASPSLLFLLLADNYGRVKDILVGPSSSRNASYDKFQLVVIVIEVYAVPLSVLWLV